MTTDTITKSKSHSHIAYQVRESKNNSYFNRIGSVFAHGDGKGFNILLDSVPNDGRITIRVNEEQPVK